MTEHASSGRNGDQLYIHSAKHACDRLQGWVSILVERSIELLSLDAGFLCKIGHASGAGDNSNRVSDIAVVSAAKRVAEKISLCLFGGKVLSRVETGEFGRHVRVPFHQSINQSSPMFVGEPLSLLDISFLRSLVPTAKQDHQFVTPAHEVDAVAGAIVDAQLRDAFADGLGIPRETEGKALDPRNDAALGALVTQAGKPAIKLRGGEDFNHERNMSTHMLTVNFKVTEE